MPLPPLPPENTARLWIQYSAGGVDHEFLVRGLAGVDPAAFVGNVRTFIQQLQATLPTNWQAYGARYAAAGQTFSTPVPFGAALPGTKATESITGITVPNFVSFVGRDGAGRKWRLSILGFMSSQEGDYRVEGGDNIDLDAARSFIQLQPTTFLTIAAFKPTVYNYFNIGRNAYWQRQQRRSGIG